MVFEDILSSIREIHVFDLDGTLVDSAAAVIGAYREAAQQLNYTLPSDFYGRSAEEWHCPEELHSLKTQLYMEKYAAQVRRGWAADALITCKQLDYVRTEIWTAASLQSFLALCAQPHLKPVLRADLLQVRQTVADKERLLADLYSYHTVPREVLLHYYDDNVEHGMQITSKYLVGVQLHTHAKESFTI